MHKFAYNPKQTPTTKTVKTVKIKYKKNTHKQTPLWAVKTVKALKTPKISTYPKNYENIITVRTYKNRPTRSNKDANNVGFKLINPAPKSDLLFFSGVRGLGKRQNWTLQKSPSLSQSKIFGSSLLVSISSPLMLQDFHSAIATLLTASYDEFL